MRLQDQIALVTGGSRGIGRGIVKAFAREGAKVAFVFRGNKEAADSLVAEITSTGGTILALQADVTSFEEAQRCVEMIEKTWGGTVTILVNNAGIIRDDLFVRMEPDAWSAVLQTNLGGAYNFSRAIAYSMMKQRKLCHQQGRHQCFHARPGGGAGEPRGDGKRHCPWIHRNRHE